jgi:hypothetical protein
MELRTQEEKAKCCYKPNVRDSMAITVMTKARATVSLL